ncbi:MAG: UPF0236 family protein [Bacteroidetes bacterium]|nr:UPF0236 family protein [Bacteroidota bacterium]
MIEVNKKHEFSKPVLGQRTSPFLQEKLIELGCEEVYGDVPERISSLLGIEVNQCQVYRSCQNVAERLDEQVLAEPSEDLSKAASQESAQVYAMVDGSMLLTDDGWQETKVGRVFMAEHDIDNEADKWKIKSSNYVARRGHYTEFTTRFERMLPPSSPCTKVFVTDGAVWIGQWIAQQYGDAVHILDFFHVCEKLAAVAPKEDSIWLDKQKTALLDSNVEGVIAAVKMTRRPAEEIQALVNYLENHKHQMDYRYYRQQRWMIGSGAIESAHRTVLQVRMKRSGQRWADAGCDNMIKLRVAYKNGRRTLIRELLKNAA